MPLLFACLLKFSISLAVVYAFYQLVLRRLTFYQWNRFYLLGYSLLCFALPFINIESWIQKPGVPDDGLITIIPALMQYPAVGAMETAAAAPAATHALNVYDWITIVLIAGTVFMLVRLLMIFLSLRRLRRKSVLLGGDGNVQLFETEAAISPFSFGSSVYFNASRHTEEELQQIIRHEYVHVRQRHTIDLLAAELLCLVNWYNPFAWMMRYSIRQNLEFIADDKVMETGVDKKEYQYLLLKVVGVSHYRIANHFNFSNLKKRILMMNKMKSARLSLGRFLFVLPLLAVLLLAFRGQHEHAIYLQTPEADTLYWNTVAVTSGQYPVYLLNGKISTPDVLKKAKQENKVKHYEYVVNAEKAKMYGPRYDCMINYITDNVQGASILTHPSKTDSTSVMKGMKGDIQGALYTGSATILKVMTDNIPFSELSARVSDGTIGKKEGYFVVQPVTPGINMDITLYVKKGTVLKELATRTFRTMQAPEWQTSK